MNYWTTTEFVNKLKDLYGEKYDYSQVIYINYYTKIKLLDKDKNKLIERLPSSLLKYKVKPENYKIKWDEIRQRMVERHNNYYDYSKVVYNGINYPITIICPEHGEFEQIPNNHINGMGCPHCRANNISKTKIQKSKENFVDKARLIHGDKYDYSLVDYKHSKLKVKIICPEHGVFEQDPNHHLRGRGCPKCSGKYRKNTQDFILECQKNNRPYDYSLVKYINNNTKIKIICPVHGVFEQTPTNHLHQNQGCPKCSEWYSSQEKVIETFLIKYNINYKKNDRAVLNGLELDFYLPDHNIALEINGLYWHSEQEGKDINYHLNKTNLCKEKDIQLIHIFEDEINLKPLIVLSKLKMVLNLFKYNLDVKDCYIKEVGENLKDKFLNKYHIFGCEDSDVNIGLYYKNNLISIATFVQYENKWELSKYSSIFNFRVEGGIDRLLKHFIQKYNPNNIVISLDQRWDNGHLYKKFGFKCIEETAPNYFYIQNSTITRIDKYNIDFNKLKKYDESKDEIENMRDNGYYRIFDCGNTIWEYRP